MSRSTRERMRELHQLLDPVSDEEWAREALARIDETAQGLLQSMVQASRTRGGTLDVTEAATRAFRYAVVLEDERERLTRGQP